MHIIIIIHPYIHTYFHRLLNEAIASGASCIYLEKPGAPTVKELEAMRDEAAKAGVEVLMGYNKNVCKVRVCVRVCVVSICMNIYIYG
jgi:predicted dehydrogenase